MCSRLSLADAQPVYDDAIRSFPVDLPAGYLAAQATFGSITP
jgi:hypothetical protein